MKNILKRQALGAYITLGALVLAIVGLILFGATLAAGDGVQTANGGELYLIASDPIFGTVTTLGIFSVLFYLVGCLAGQFRFAGIVGKVIDAVGYVFRVLAPVFLILTFVAFLNGTLTGLGWTFFSNEELEINPDAITAGYINITGLAFIIVSAVAGIVAAFFKVTKDVEEAQPAPEAAE